MLSYAITMPWLDWLVDGKELRFNWGLALCHYGNSAAEEKRVDA